MINSFVSEKTRGLIPRIIENVIDKDTAMVLVNALYFKGVWRNTKNPRPSRERFNANIKSESSPECSDMISENTMIGMFPSGGRFEVLGVKEFHFKN